MPRLGTALLWKRRGIASNARMMARNRRGDVPQSRDGLCIDGPHAQQYRSGVLHALRTSDGQSEEARGRRREKERRRLPGGPRSHMSVSKQKISVCSYPLFNTVSLAFQYLLRKNPCKNNFWENSTVSVNQLLVTRIIFF